MSLYQTGTCNMTNNSAAVVGVGTAFLANVTAGDGFLISGETVYYTVLSVTDDTHLTLSVVYAGVTGNGKTYQISRDWTVNLGLAEIQPGDPNWPFLLTQKVIRKLDTDIAAKAPLASPTLITPKSTTTIGVGNATPAASGAGITFPAAQSASTDPNTLDDYEEGTWTPVLGDGTNNYSIVPTPQTRYTKIGRLVTCFAFVSWDSIGAAGGTSWRIGGLPFAIENLSGYPAATFGEVGGVDNAGGKQLVGRGQVDTTYMQGSVINDNAAPTTLAANAQSASGYLVVSITYNT